MKVTILNGNPDEKKFQFDSFLRRCKELLESEHHRVTLLNLVDMDIKYCTGCWGCWVKTPGECLFGDDSKIIRREVIKSDFVLLASPMIMGFTSALLKKAMDKFIPLVHPYIELVQGECHHRARYDHYPQIGLWVQSDRDTDDEDLKITEDIFKRLALNFKTKFVFMKSFSESAEEVANEIGSL